MRLPTLLSLVTLSLLVFSCQDNPQRHLKLGNWYYQKGLIDDAILEYRESIRLHPTDPNELTREELSVLMKAHYNLAIAYSRKGWYDFALKEAQTSFDMWPTKETYEMVELLKKRRSLERLEIETGS
ncbi:MAG: tetratricopeptide repeat protein [Fidelibacterota bacterium]